MGENDLGGLLGIDPEQLKSLLAQFQPSEEDKRQARAQALMSMGFGILGGHGGTMRALGQGGLLGMNTYDTSIKDAQARRSQLLQQAGILQDMQRRSALMGQLVPPQGGQTPSQAPAVPPAFGMQDRGVGMPQPQPQQSPMQSGAQGGGNMYQKLRAIGVSDAEIAMAAQSKDPATAVAELFKEYTKPIFGAGNVPIKRTAQGFVAAPAVGYNEALAAQTKAQEEAKAGLDLVDVPTGEPGKTIKMPRAEAVKLLGGKTGTTDPEQRITLNLKDVPLSHAQAMIDDARKNPMQRGAGLGITDPLALKMAEEGFMTGEQQKRAGWTTMLENSKLQYEDVRKGYMASRDLGSHVANMRKLDQEGVFSGPIQQWSGKFASAWNSAFPESSINSEKLANSQTFQSEVSKMQQAIARTFPGQQSDRELVALTASLPTLMMTPQGRAQVYETLDRKISDANHMYKSASSFYRSNNGNLVGWEPPPFTPPGAGYGRSQAQQTGSALTPAEADELARLRKKYGR